MWGFLINKHSNESETSKKRSFIGELILDEGIVRPQLLRSRTLLLSGTCVCFVGSEQQYELFKASCELGQQDSAGLSGTQRDSTGLHRPQWNSGTQPIQQILNSKNRKPRFPSRAEAGEKERRNFPAFSSRTDLNSKTLSEPYLSVCLFDFACCDPSIKEVWPQSAIIFLRFSL